jgi:hypothetical protein
LIGGAIWACPYTLLGASIGVLGLLTGGRAQWRTCAVEFHGGAVGKFLYYVCGPWVSAITFGHTILGRDAAALDVVRTHEWVHVRQYQRWGPFFGPAYVLSSLYQWCHGNRAYRDNHFEVEAYDYCENLQTVEVSARGNRL